MDIIEGYIFANALNMRHLNCATSMVVFWSSYSLARIISLCLCLCSGLSHINTFVIFVWLIEGEEIMQ